MSQKLVSRNADLSRLRSDGLDLLVGKSSFLLVRNVPYVNSAKQVKRGIIACTLDLAGETTVAPDSHVVFFVGDPPCDHQGSVLPGVSQNTNHAVGDGMIPNHQFSRKPTTGATPGKYPDYYEKIRTYVAILQGPAQAIDPAITAYTRPVVVPDEDDESVFEYLDTAATKAGIVAANDKLVGKKVAIVGLGGSGGYVLDFLAKLPLAEIHLFDGDVFLNHNAFRCPGAASLADLSAKLSKVDYLSKAYGKMRKAIIPHNCFIDASTAVQLTGMDFVFICVDRGSAKRLIVETLESRNVPFVDVGMGIQLGEDNTLGGVVTATANMPAKRDHFRVRVGLSDGQGPNEYSNDVHIAELNALSAVLAVVKWKKIMGYFDDSTKENFCAYTVRTNQLISEDAL